MLAGSSQTACFLPLKHTKTFPASGPSPWKLPPPGSKESESDLKNHVFKSVQPSAYMLLLLRLLVILFHPTN